jgi:hypothetical protein
MHPAALEIPDAALNRRESPVGGAFDLGFQPPGGAHGQVQLLDETVTAFVLSAQRLFGHVLGQKRARSSPESLVLCGQGNEGEIHSAPTCPGG